MKKFTLLFALSILAFSFSHAQKFGVTGGWNIASVGGDLDNDDINIRLAPHLGVHYDHAFSESSAISFGLMYSGQGYKAANADISWRINYINLPIVYRYYFFKGFSVLGGLQPGFNVSSKVKSGDTTLDVKDDTNGFDLGLPIGASYEFDFGLTLGVRHIWGLSDISKNDNPDMYHPNRVIQFSAGYLFKK